jgi:transcription elongation factor Elf1
MIKWFKNFFKRKPKPPIKYYEVNVCCCNCGHKDVHNMECGFSTYLASYECKRCGVYVDVEPRRGRPTRQYTSEDYFSSMGNY